MIRRFAGVLLLAVWLCPAAPSLAQEDSAEAAFSVLVGLLDRGADRNFFGLPEDTHWRLEGPVQIGLFSADFARQTPVLAALAEQITEACGVPFQVILAADPADPDSLMATVVPSLSIHIGPRQEMAALAVAFAVNRSALERFEDGRWPFVFDFPRNELRVGQVWMADDEPALAQDAGLILALFWALGAATLGGDLAGLVDRDSTPPRLTDLGLQVVATLCHPDLEAGLPIPVVLQRARDVLGLES